MDFENNPDQEEEADEIDSIEEKTLIPNQSALKAKMRLNLREEHEKIFEDEVEYETKELVRDKFKDYKYMKSFSMNEWDKYDSLPTFYQKLYSFKKIKKTHKFVINRHREFAVAFEGSYVTLKITDPKLREQLLNFDNSVPIIVSSLFEHERKLSLNHCKVRFHNTNEERVLSKRVYEIHTGFRKQNTNISFSNIYTNCDKYKSVRKIDPEYNLWYLGSYYSQVYFPPNNVLILFPDDYQFEQINEEEKKVESIGQKFGDEK